MAKLTPRQKKFIDYYLDHIPYSTLNAYIEVYGDRGSHEKNVKNASQIFNMPAAKEYREQREKEILEEVGCNAVFIGRKLMDMATAAKDDQYYTPSIQVKALDLLQKQLGVQSSKAQIDATLAAAVQFVEDIPNAD